MLLARGGALLPALAVFETGEGPHKGLGVGFSVSPFPTFRHPLRVRNPPGVYCILVHEDPLAIPLEIVELTGTGRPEEDDDGPKAQKDHARNKTVDDFHGAGFSPG